MAVRQIDIDLDEDDRIETGAVQFNDDWPGLFIRGDEAFSLWVALSMAAKTMPDAMPFIKQTCAEYADLIDNEVKVKRDNN